MGSVFSSSSQSIDDTMYSMMFLPPIYPNLKKQMDSLSNNKDIKFINLVTSSNDTINLMQVSKPTNSKKWIIFSHGNAALSINYYDLAMKYSNNLNVNSIFYDYPGYGCSTGKPTEDSCFESLSSVVKHLINDMKVDIQDIILIGQSIGTGVVVDYIYKSKWQTPSILISPYTSILDIVSSTSCSSGKIDKFQSLKKIKKIDCPIKIFHGDQDEVINISLGKLLYDELRNKKFKPVWMKGIGHNNIIENIHDYDLMEVINNK